MNTPAPFGSVHLDDDDRRRQLLDIESRLKEHPFPPQLVVENTSYCNLCCVHCAHQEMKRPQKHMARALWNRIVDEVGRVGPETEIWPTFYGEALILGDELWDRLDYAARAGCRHLVLNSNGTLLNRRDNVDRILRSPLRRFILSLDGLSKDVFEAVRVKARWDEVYAGVEELCRQRLARGLQYPVIVAQFSVMKQNQHEVAAFREYWKARGAEVKIRPMLEWTASGSIRTDTIRHDSDFRIACPWSHNTMAIQQDGRVSACAVDYEGRFDGGDVTTDSIADLWARLARSMRAPHRDHRWPDLPEICQGCGDWQVAGAEYEAETIDGTRPFWFYELLTVGCVGGDRSAGLSVPDPQRRAGWRRAMRRGRAGGTGVR